MFVGSVLDEIDSLSDVSADFSSHFLRWQKHQMPADILYPDCIDVAYERLARDFGRFRVEVARVGPIQSDDIAGAKDAAPRDLTAIYRVSPLHQIATGTPRVEHRGQAALEGSLCSLGNQCVKMAPVARDCLDASVP